MIHVANGVEFVIISRVLLPAPAPCYVQSFIIAFPTLKRLVLTPWPRPSFPVCCMGGWLGAVVKFLLGWDSSTHAVKSKDKYMNISSVVSWVLSAAVVPSSCGAGVMWCCCQVTVARERSPTWGGVAPVSTPWSVPVIVLPSHSFPVPVCPSPSVSTCPPHPPRFLFFSFIQFLFYSLFVFRLRFKLECIRVSTNFCD